MPTDYGRGGAAAAQKGLGVGGRQYRAFSPSDVEERLTGSEFKEYQSALKTLAGPAQLKHSGAIKKKYLRRQEEAMDQANRLRELAASRAFTDFSTTAMQYSKPWLVQRPQEGLIRGETVPYGLGRRPVTSLSFAGEGIRAAPPSVASLMGEHQFRPIGYEASKQIKRGKRLTEIPYGRTSFSSGSNSELPLVDLGNFNFSLGRF